MSKAIEHYKHMFIRCFYYLCRPIYYFIMEMFWLITKELERSVTKESIQKVFIALRWSAIRNEEVHVYCIQKSSSRVFVQLCTTVTVTQFLSLQAEFTSVCVCVCVAGIHQHDWCVLAVWYQSSEMMSMSSELPCWVATLQRLTCWPPFLFCCGSGDSSSSFCLLCLVLLFWNQTFTLTRATKKGHFFTYQLKTLT